MVAISGNRAASIGLSYTSFGLTLIGGLISSTLFTLLDDLRTIVVAAVRLNPQSLLTIL